METESTIVEAAIQNQEVQTQICNQNEQEKTHAKTVAPSPITSVSNNEEDTYVDCTYNPFVLTHPLIM